MVDLLLPRADDGVGLIAALRDRGRPVIAISVQASLRRRALAVNAKSSSKDGLLVDDIIDDIRAVVAGRCPPRACVICPRQSGTPRRCAWAGARSPSAGHGATSAQTLRRAQQQRVPTIAVDRGKTRRSSDGSDPAGSIARTVAVELDARETPWQVAAGHTVPGHAFNGQIPGPAIEASVDDTPAGKPDPHRLGARQARIDRAAGCITATSWSTTPRR